MGAKLPGDISAEDVAAMSGTDLPAPTYAQTQQYTPPPPRGLEAVARQILSTGGIGGVLGLSKPAPAPAPPPASPPTDAAAPTPALADAPPPAPAPGAMPIIIPQGGYGGPVRLEERDILGPGQRAALTAARTAEQDRIAQSEQRSLEQSQAEQAAAYDHARRLQAQEEGRADAEARRGAELRARQNDFDAAVKEAASMKIDHDRWKQDAPGAIAATLGAALGAFASARGGGPNLAMQMLDKRIERDIDAQKAEYAAKRDRAAGAQNAYSMAMARFGDERAAETVARAAQRDIYAAQLQRLAAQSKDLTVQDNAAQAAVALADKRAQDALQFVKLTPAGGGGGGGGGQAATALAKMPELPGDRLHTLPDGRQVLVTPERKKDLDEQAEGVAAMNDSAQRIAQLRAKLKLGTGPAGLGGVVAGLNPFEYQQRQADLEALRAEQARLGLAAKRAAGPGMSSDADQRRLDQTVGALDSNNPHALVALQNELRERQAAYARGVARANGTPVQGFTTVDPKTGQYVNRYVAGPGFAAPPAAGGAAPAAPPITPFGGGRK